LQPSTKLSALLAKLKENFTENELVLALKQNNERAFHYLYDNYSGAIFGVISKIIKDNDQAQDVMQDVFTKIWKNIASYNPEKGRLFTWMLNIARNTSIDLVRSESSRPILQDIEQHTESYDQYASYQPSTMAMDLNTIVEKLTPDRKLLVDLVYMQGYTQEEVSAQLEIPLGTVKTRVRAALHELKRHFGI
jgi:RNA polymerase sigma factor (sigma-70 family)